MKLPQQRSSRPGSAGAAAIPRILWSRPCPYWQSQTSSIVVMRILAITNMYPSKEHPASGTFVEQQVKGLRQAGLAVKLMDIDRTGQGRWAYGKIGRRAAERVTRSKCDLVHVMYGGVMARTIATLADRIPMVVSLCGDDILGTVGTWPVAFLRSWLNRTASIRACKMADAIVVKSENLAAAISPFVDRAKIHLIQNGIDVNRFRPLDRGLCVRQLGWAIDSFHILFPVNGDPDVKRLRLAGKSAQLARGLGIPVEFHPIQDVPHEQAPVWLNASDVLLLTSVHEGSPNIVKEGLGCDLPVVSVDVGDVAERIRGVEGCHIVPADPMSIALKLEAVALRGRRIEGRSRVLDLSLPKIAERLRRLYNLVLEKRRTRGDIVSVASSPFF
jgi:teichuronic acid biosynthesis glycosyltransferase TuaC